MSLSTDRATLTVAELIVAALSRKVRHCVDVAPGLSGYVAASVCEKGRSCVVVVANNARVEAVANNMFALTERRPLRIEQQETSPYAQRMPDRAFQHRRLASLCRLCDAAAQAIVIAAPALIEKVPRYQRLAGRCLQIRPAQTIRRDRLQSQLQSHGYLRVPLVEDPGTYAVRGGIVDVWSPGSEQPVRIELDGDDIESLRHFDPSNQRTTAALAQHMLLPALPYANDSETLQSAAKRVRELCDAVNLPSTRTRALTQDIRQGRTVYGANGLVPAFEEVEALYLQLPHDALVLVEESLDSRKSMQQHFDSTAEDALLQTSKPHFEVDELYASPQQAVSWLEEQSAVAIGQGLLGTVAGSATTLDDDVSSRIPSLASFEPIELRRAVEQSRANEGHAAGLKPAIDQIVSWLEDGFSVFVTARGHVQAERLATMLKHRELSPKLDFTKSFPEQLGEAKPGRLCVCSAALSDSFVSHTEKLICLNESTLLGTKKKGAARSRKSRPTTKRKLDELRSLVEGDFVVHIEHGIGRYDGLCIRQVGSNQVEFLQVTYASQDKLYLPVYRLNQLHKYRSSKAQPRLDKLGGQTFARSKSRASKKIRDIADHLLQLYAERRRIHGQVTPPIDDEYRAFEAAFPHVETHDQQRAIEEVGQDLEEPLPMDRLICGDVGFGKTEVALRAAFRVAMSGRQVALLCPTTILAQQHHQTCLQRFSNYPLRVATLSRFVTKKEQAKIVKELRAGTVDIVVGTHRLLSKDVHFKQLGLLVIDEEQRFGVTAKERIKGLRQSVDVLTLTATPIPRTLQMAIGGIRDLSLIATPPTTRLAVRTIVSTWDPSTLKEALGRELSRGGQVFFVYNRIEGLSEKAAAIQQLCPQARIALAHGRMKEAALERTMLDFVAGKYDVLCSTAIVESGLDIPRCNTMIIDNAPHFGLAQLYQLRGRVGRGSERAYCYLLSDAPERLSDEAKRRLDAAVRHSELGSGFEIARIDLEQRGGGDLLGAQQSGTVASIGLSLFGSLLEKAVRQLQGEPERPENDPELSFDAEALIPEEYVQDVGIRLSCYKQLASATDRSEVHAIAAELEDRFGPAPKPVRKLVRLMALKTELAALAVLSCEATAQRVSCHLATQAPLHPQRLMAAMKQSPATYRLTPDMKLSRKTAAGEAFSDGLDATEQMLAEIASAKERRPPAGSQPTP